MFDELINLIERSQEELPWLVQGIMVLWGIHGLNWLCGRRLNLLGIVPRTPAGLLGIIFSPVLHGNVNHLFFNSIPLFVLSLFLLAASVELYLKVTCIVWLGAGVLTWLFARRAVHIGASGVIAGYFSFILSQAYHAPSVVSVILAAVALYYFGGILFSVLPSEEKISWEAHLFGFVAGIGAAML